MRLSLLVLLTACTKPYADLSTLDFSEIPYENEWLETDSAVVSAFDIDLECPDGEPARMFAVYRSDLEGPAPVAIVLHSGAFDYVPAPDPDGPLEGQHYQGDSRLDRYWAIAKVWETLGINSNVVDPSESNSGTLAAALTDAGVVQLYPGNCWGDLWHNEQGYQESETEIDGFARNGRTFAYWMVRMVIEQSFAGDKGFQVPVALDTSEFYLVGLGDGGRGVAELLSHDNMPTVAGVLIDSSPDLLSPYVQDPLGFSDEVEGLRRIFLEQNLATIDDWSLHSQALAGTLPNRVGYVWSDTDPRLPQATIAPTADLLASQGAWVRQVDSAAHVLLNDDPELAAEAVDFLLGGAAGN